MTYKIVTDMAAEKKKKTTSKTTAKKKGPAAKAAGRSGAAGSKAKTKTSAGRAGGKSSSKPTSKKSGAAKKQSASNTGQKKKAAGASRSQAGQKARRKQTRQPAADPNRRQGARPQAPLTQAVTADSPGEILVYGGMDNRALEEILRNGEMPDFTSMQGYLYRGLNTGKTAKLAGVQKFIKGFYFDKSYDEGGVFNFGYNVPAKQDGLSNEWTGKTARDGELKRFGFYRVYPVRQSERDNKYPNALLLNYGCKINGRLDPTRTLRDYVVRIKPGSDDLLLGKAYLNLGGLRVLAGFFILERKEQTDFDGPGNK